ncbi:MAG: hypothetical protein H6Q60_1574 [Oscillospiraceae bacterium]|nr:hypothetical protein [Oscillospiraceae bacterium]
MASEQQSKSDKSKWYRLDNAALMYSAIQRNTYSAVFRFSAVMTGKVNPDVLQRAIALTIPRFPTFRVKMKRGVFWYYFEPNDAPGPFLKADISNFCQPMRAKEDHDWLIRFFYYENRISIECFHALADGAGALTLFRTLLAVYLRELGYRIPAECGVCDMSASASAAEQEDAYQRYAGSVAAHGGIPRKAYSAGGTPEPFYTLNVTMGLIPLDALAAKAKEQKVSVTEYLAAALIYVLLERQRREGFQKKLPVALAIPINLRGWFPSDTLRNFILTVSPSVDPNLGDYTFEEIVTQVHHYMRLNVNRKLLQARLTGNVRFQRNRLLQIIPCVLKNPILGFCYWFAGVYPVSATYTNPGAFTVPTEMQPHIQRMEVILGQPYGNRVNCASISYGNVMELTIAGNIRERDIERELFRFLVRQGLKVKMISNREE